MHARQYTAYSQQGLVYRYAAMMSLPGQVLCMFPGASARATCSLSRLTSRNVSSLDSLARILLRRTASTSMAPLEEPSTIFSTVSLLASSVYFAMSASKNDTPYDIAALGRMNEPAFLILHKSDE